MSNITHSKAKDPLGHIKISVSNFQKSYLFYQGLFVLLNYQCVSDKANRAGWVSSLGFGIWIAQAKSPDHDYQFGAPGLHHLCLKASSLDAVDTIYAFAEAEHARIFDRPRKYPDYTTDYYAVFFADPDGIKIEVAYY